MIITVFLAYSLKIRQNDDFINPLSVAQRAFVRFLSEIKLTYPTTTTSISWQRSIAQFIYFVNSNALPTKLRNQYPKCETYNISSSHRVPWKCYTFVFFFDETVIDVHRTFEPKRIFFSSHSSCSGSNRRVHSIRSTINYVRFEIECSFCSIASTLFNKPKRTYKPCHRMNANGLLLLFQNTCWIRSKFARQQSHHRTPKIIDQINILPNIFFSQFHFHLLWFAAGVYLVCETNPVKSKLLQRNKIK